MGHQGMLIEIAKEYVVLATNQSQSLMCGGQMSCNKHSMDGWAAVEPQIVWNRSAVLNLPQSSAEQSSHYVAVGKLPETKTPESEKLALPQRKPSVMFESPREANPSNEDASRAAASEKSTAKEASAKGKKRFRIFRAMRSVIKSRFKK